VRVHQRAEDGEGHEVLLKCCPSRVASSSLNDARSIQLAETHRTSIGSVKIHHLIICSRHSIFDPSALLAWYSLDSVLQVPFAPLVLSAVETSTLIMATEGISWLATLFSNLVFVARRA
jgi:hypothetical protein